MIISFLSHDHILFGLVLHPVLIPLKAEGPSFLLWFCLA
jgi:hypothetical protein